MNPAAPLLGDPWCDWPDGDPYAALAPAGVSPQSPQAAVRQAFFDLMERGLVGDRVRAAHNLLKIVGRRLAADALMYDAGAAEDMLALLENPPEGDAPALSRAVPFSWDI